MTQLNFVRPSRFRTSLIATFSLIATSLFALAPTPRMASAAEFSFSQLSVSMRGVCSVSTTGVGVCWGDNSNQYLLPNMPSGRVSTPTKVLLPNGEIFASIDVGEAYSACALAVSGHAYCWGEHHLGSYFTTTSRTPVQVEFPNDMRVTNVQSGGANGCALDSDRYLWCWGDPLTLGDGSSEPIRIPTQIGLPDNAKVAQYDMGVGNTCVVTDLGHLYCWGDNDDGEYGLGYAQQISNSTPRVPVLVPPPIGITFASVSVGLNRVCALSTTGVGYCWGDNYNGSFGNNTYDDSLRPTPMVVPNAEQLIQVSTGWYHTCVLTTSHKTWCFGEGSNGELGSGTTLGGKTYRTPYILNGTQFQQVFAGLAGTCAIDFSPKVWCWGGPRWYSDGYSSPHLFPNKTPDIGTPAINNLVVNSIDTSTAQVQADISALGFSTTTRIEYDTDPNFGSPNQVSSNVVIGDDIYTSSPISINISGLLPHTTYHYRFVATNAYGSATSSTNSFTTLGQAPTVSAVTFSAVTGNEFTATVDVNPGRLSTSINFEFASDVNFTNNRQIISLTGAAGSRSVTRTTVINNLEPLHRYYARVAATNQLGTTINSVQTIETVGSLPSVTLTSVSATSRVISLQADISTGQTKGNVIAQASLTGDFSFPQNSEISSFTSNGPTQHELIINAENLPFQHGVDRKRGGPDRVFTLGGASHGEFKFLIEFVSEFQVANEVAIDHAWGVLRKNGVGGGKMTRATRIRASQHTSGLPTEQSSTIPPPPQPSRPSRPWALLHPAGIPGRWNLKMAAGSLGQ